MITRYVTSTRVARIEERFVKVPLSGRVGQDAQMAEISTGWWLVTESPEPYAICVGPARPPHAVGQPIRLILEIGS